MKYLNDQIYTKDKNLFELKDSNGGRADIASEISGVVFSELSNLHERTLFIGNQSWNVTEKLDVNISVPSGPENLIISNVSLSPYKGTARKSALKLNGEYKNVTINGCSLRDITLDLRGIKCHQIQIVNCVIDNSIIVHSNPNTIHSSNAVYNNSDIYRTDVIYVDKIDGDNEIGNGTLSNPYRTVDHVKTNIIIDNPIRYNIVELENKEEENSMSEPILSWGSIGGALIVASIFSLLKKKGVPHEQRRKSISRYHEADY